MYHTVTVLAKMLNKKDSQDAREIVVQCFSDTLLGIFIINYSY